MMLEQMNEQGREIQKAQGGPIPTYAAEGSGGFFNVLRGALMANPDDSKPTIFERQAGITQKDKKELAKKARKRDTSIDDDILDAIAMIESNNKHYDKSTPSGLTEGFAKNKKGERALGKYQWLPSSAANPGYGIKGFDVYTASPEVQRNKTKEYLRAIQKAHPEFELMDVIRAYNAGPRTIQKSRGGTYDGVHYPESNRVFTEQAYEYPYKVMREAGLYNEEGLPSTYENFYNAKEKLPAVLPIPSPRNPMNLDDYLELGKDSPNRMYMGGEIPKYAAQGTGFFDSILDFFKSDEEEPNTIVKDQDKIDVPNDTQFVPEVIVPPKEEEKVTIGGITKDDYDTLNKDIKENPPEMFDPSYRTPQDDIPSLAGLTTVGTNNLSKEEKSSIDKQIADALTKEADEDPVITEDMGVLETADTTGAAEKIIQKDPDMFDKTKSFLSEYFGDMVDGKLLARMTVQYLGSRALGYGHRTSLRYGAKDYMTQLDKAPASKKIVPGKYMVREGFASLQPTIDVDGVPHFIDVKPNGEAQYVNAASVGGREAIDSIHNPAVVAKDFQEKADTAFSNASKVAGVEKDLRLQAPISVGNEAQSIVANEMKKPGMVGNLERQRKIVKHMDIALQNYAKDVARYNSTGEGRNPADGGLIYYFKEQRLAVNTGIAPKLIEGADPYKTADLINKVELQVGNSPTDSKIEFGRGAEVWGRATAKKKKDKNYNMRGFDKPPEGYTPYTWWMYNLYQDEGPGYEQAVSLLSENILAQK